MSIEPIRAVHRASELFLQRGNEIKERTGATWKQQARAMRSDLIARYGHGDEPTYRLRVYDKVAECVEKYGECAVKLVSDLIRASSGKKMPDRYFVTSFLREADKRGWMNP